MTLKTYLAIISVIGIVHGLGFLLAPGQFGLIYGWHETPDIQLAGRYFGASLLAWGLIGWFAQDFTDFTAIRGVLIPCAIGHFAGLIVTVLGILSGVINAVSWLAALAYLFGLVGAVYFLTPRSRDA